MKEAGPHVTDLGGNFTPRARNASATDEPIVVSGNGKPHGSPANSDSATLPPRAHRLFGPATTRMRS